jgi:PAS domain S-box-containing protein
MENNKVIGGSCFSRNITESKRAMETIRKSEKMMTEAQRIGSFGSWEYDLVDKTTLQWSDEVFRIFGYEPGGCTVNATEFYKAVHPEDLDAIHAATTQALEKQTRYSIDHRVLRPDGSIRWVRENADIIVDKTGTPTRMIGTIQDITDRKVAELAQKKAEANLRNILENTDTAYVLLDKTATVLSYNHVAADLAISATGQAINEGISYIGMMPNERKTEVTEKIANTIKTKEPISYEAFYKDPEEQINWLFVSMHPILNDDGEALGLSIAAHNITERKRLEQERTKMTNDLLQRNKDLEQFTYIVSHNLRAPVANITGLSAVIQIPGLSPEKYKECISGLMLSVKRLDDVVLDLNHILQVRREISEQKNAVVFSEIVHNISESVHSLVEKENVTITTDFAACNEMFTIKSYLYSIFYNLISNSIKYRKASAPPVIEISSRRVDHSLQLVFKDNGMGIDLSAHGEKVFGLYKRFHLNVEGKGMGLFMVKTQVETIGGRIDIKSAVNEGTTITIEFDAIN